MTFYDETEFETEPEADETPSAKQLSYDIDEALANLRPERYHAADKDWMAPVVEMVRESLTKWTPAEVIRDAAQRRVHRRESEATKRTNRILRDIDKTKQLPLGWGEGDKWRETHFDLLALPLSIAGERVRIGTAGPSDLEQWELESGREEDKRRAAQISARNGARLLVGLLRQQGADHVEDLQTRGQ